jgi:hypothetical protein
MATNFGRTRPLPREGDAPMTSAPIRDTSWQPQLAGWPATPQRRARATGRPGRQTRTPGWHEMPTTPQPTMTPLNVNHACCDALFASALQPSDCPTADMVAEAISWTLRQFGVRGCASRWHRSSATTPTRPPAGCAGCASSPRRREADDERDLRPVRASGPRGVPRRPGWRALPMQTLRQPAMAGPVRARLDYLAHKRACARAAGDLATAIPLAYMRVACDAT